MIWGALLTQFSRTNERPPNGHTWSRERRKKVQSTSRPEYVWPEVSSNVSKKFSTKKMNGIGFSTGRSSTMLEKLRGSYDVDPEDVEVKKNTMKNERTRLEVQLESAMPCKSRSSTVTPSLKTFKDPIKSACDSQYGEARSLFNSHMNDCKMTEKKHNLNPMWKRSMKHVNLEKPMQFSDQSYLGCTERECKPNHNLVDESITGVRPVNEQTTTIIWECLRSWLAVAQQHHSTKAQVSQQANQESHCVPVRTFGFATRCRSRSRTSSRGPRGLAMRPRLPRSCGRNRTTPRWAANAHPHRSRAVDGRVWTPDDPDFTASLAPTPAMSTFSGGRGTKSSWQSGQVVLCLGHRKKTRFFHDYCENVLGCHKKKTTSHGLSPLFHTLSETHLV